MIRLRKGPPPPVLVEKAEDWTKEFLDAIASGGEISKTIRFRYRDPKIKAAIRRDSYGKCIYCELLLPTGETDHIDPVSICPHLIVAWENLALVCKECNTKKSDYYKPDEPLINPFVDDPAIHLLFLGPSVFPVVSDAKGLRTFLKLELDRIDLLQRRQRRLERLRPLVEEWQAHPAGATKELLKQELLNEAADNAEFAAAVRAFLFQILGWKI